MINVSPIGRNASHAERLAYQTHDLAHSIRSTFVSALKSEFPDYNLTYSIGGQISFDIFPRGWDKTYCLQHLEREVEISGTRFEKIHFFGDKTQEVGNDYEIFEDKRTTGHAVRDPEETMRVLRGLFDL